MYDFRHEYLVAAPFNPHQKKGRPYCLGRGWVVPLVTSAAIRLASLRQHGITLERYEEMLAAQGGCCAICRLPPPEGVNLAVDHDHECCPGKFSCGECVRSLLCASCNLTLGRIEAGPAPASAFADYLDEHQPQRERLAVTPSSRKNPFADAIDLRACRIRSP